MDIKEHILTETDKLFCRYGIKSVTMDDIARQLGISKKTIYQFFKDKNELVQVLIAGRMELQECAIDVSIKNSENAVEEIFSSVTEMKQLLSNTNAMLFYDLQKYHPEVWNIFKKFKDTKLKEAIRSNLERGIHENLFRSDINIDILTRLRLEQVERVLSGMYMTNDYSLVEVMTEITEHFLYGVCSLKGHQLLNEYRNTNEN
ncbi:TetR family transcriptional regulator [Pedobacter sp. HMF7647]|uniref:TetR family transcriptional regulator n=1 Tax=Hufsiella arboris TaxID=2695275 RepID=A0A7K1YA34_9SPHI|nr:TetR/AcrR family transcriptional regulator [Hufsiella arboris]MXV51201.1 TetR family transcriptional regulator [Hufsiella arboris]